MSKPDLLRAFNNPIEQYFEQAATMLAASQKEWQPATARQIVLDCALFRLYCYSSAHKHSMPVSGDDVVLIVYAMVNTASILDLCPQSSMIERLQQQGLSVYLMEWKAPQLEQSCFGIKVYLEQSVDVCVQHIQSAHQLEQVNLLGVCQGGVFALCYTALFPSKVRKLVPMVTPVNFHTEQDTLSLWARYLDFEKLLHQGENISGALLAQMFLALKPMTLSVQKYLDVADNLNKPEAGPLSEKFMAMERWIQTTPDQPAQVFREFVTLFYQQNALYQGSLLLSGKAVTLQSIQSPIFNIYAQQDHLVPPESSMALAHAIPENQYQDYAVNTGHIGMFVSQKSLACVPDAIACFLRQ